jgi:ElaB/YqjD/DUF883 family membrane-anchored ribosome-binding protein
MESEPAWVYIDPIDSISNKRSLEMADDKNLEKSTEANSKSRSKRSASGRGVGSANEIDLAAAESRAEGEGFNHPHASTELNMTTDAKAEPSRLAGLSRDEILSNVKDYAKEYGGKARETAESVRKQATEFAKKFEDVPARSREVFGKVDSSTRANPWLSIAVTGAGALALGFLAGKLFARASKTVGEAGYDFDQATDE